MHDFEVIIVIIEVIISLKMISESRHRNEVIIFIMTKEIYALSVKCMTHREKMYVLIMDGCSMDIIMYVYYKDYVIMNIESMYVPI